MTRNTFLLILLSVAFSASAQILLKMGMATPAIQAILADGLGLGTVLGVFGNWRVLLGLLVYFLSAAVWLLVLARVDVSLAYPFVGLGVVLTMLFGWLIRNEPLSAGRIGGTALIVAGIVFITRSA